MATIHLNVTTTSTEGSGGTWERLEYDWSDPKRVVVVREGKTVKAIEARNDGSRAAEGA